MGEESRSLGGFPDETEVFLPFHRQILGESGYGLAHSTANLQPPIVFIWWPRA
jgi:hypothetical protein